MFGFLYSLFLTLGYTTNKFSEAIEDNKCKQIYKNNDGLTYTDSKGRSRLLSTNEIVFYSHKPNGDYVLEDIGGKIIKNFTLEKKKARLEELENSAKTNNCSTYCIDENDHRHDRICQGKRFKDFKTGNIYVIRGMYGRYYYMDIETGFIVRKTDWQIKREQDGLVHPLVKDIDIEEFNKKQSTFKDNPGMLYRNFDYIPSFDYYK